MYFNIKCIGKLPGPKNEFQRSLVFETGEFERPKFDCIEESRAIFFFILIYFILKVTKIIGQKNGTSIRFQRKFRQFCTLSMLKY